MAKKKICSFCKEEVDKLWYSSPRTCMKSGCRVKGYAEIRAKKGEKAKPYKSPIKQLSSNRAKEYALYRPLRDKYMKEHPICERCGVKSATDLHHRAGRIGKLLYATAYFCALCRECHSYIETHPEWAKENGFSLSRIDK